jgi:hypothetical protein
MNNEEIDRAQHRLEHLFTKEWLMQGVVCLLCNKPWVEWTDKLHDQCGCDSKCVVNEKTC